MYVECVVFKNYNLTHLVTIEIQFILCEVDFVQLLLEASFKTLCTSTITDIHKIQKFYGLMISLY